MAATIGVLIIGSLYWRQDCRKRWRDCRLNWKCQWLVTAPIRYGRLSGTPPKTYTMVFGEPGETQRGQAVVVQCQRPASNLIEEAEWLWAAEQTSSNHDHVPLNCTSSPEHRIAPATRWGCVALLSNPQSNLPQELAVWRARVAAEPNYTANPPNLRRLVNPEGELQIPWPTVSDGSPLPLDLLLATSNDPEPVYPTPPQIAAAWKRNTDPDRVGYFHNNRKYGIFTFQDEDIQKLL